MATFNSVAQNSGAGKADILKLKSEIESDPSNLSKHRAYIKLMRTDYEAEMDKQYAVWMKKFAKQAIIPLAIGTAYEGGENAKAKPYLLKAVSLNPKLAEGWAALAGDAERWGLFSEARNYLEKAVAAEPENADYLFSYAFSFTDVDEAKYVKLSKDLIERFPKHQRAAQALYWLAIREHNMDQKMKYWEWLRKEYPAGQFNWSVYGMEDYFNALLSVDPEKAEGIATEMLANKEEGKKWQSLKDLATEMSVVKKLLAQNKAAEARAILEKIKLARNNAFAKELTLLKAKADDLSGKTATAYDSLIVAYVNTAKNKFRENLNVYGKKLGKNIGQIDFDVKQQIDKSAKPATPFTLKNYLTNTNTSLEDYRGKVVLLTYWFPGCGPCRAEFPHFENVVRKFKGRDLEYVGINIVSKQNEYVLPFLKGSGYGFTPLEDVKGRAKGTLDNRGLAPINFLIDRDGRVIFSFFRTEASNEDELEAMINMLLSAKKS